MTEKQQTTVKTATGQVIGVSTGNAAMYFIVEYIEYASEYRFDDPAVAVVMGGTLLSVVVMQGFPKALAVAKYVFDRFFPEK